jgi:hypothetical protein
MNTFTRSCPTAGGQLVYLKMIYVYKPQSMFSQNSIRKAINPRHRESSIPIALPSLMRRNTFSSVKLDHHVFTPRTAVPRGTSQLVRTIQQQLHLRVILVIDSTLLVAPEFPDPGEHPRPVAVASREDVLGLLLGDTGPAVESIVVYFDERVARCRATSALVVFARLTSDAALMDCFRFHLLE